MNESSEIVMAEVVEAPPNRSILEQLMRPESIQRMMQFGGFVLVLGCALWLWSIGLFDHPIVGAITLGGLNLAALAAGCFLIDKSRFKLAGQGLTLLGSLALPLNLWFYDAQGLVTLGDGGHLWMPAALICVIYAFVASVLKKPSFVYAFVSGVVLTGMLFLADRTIGLFWQWTPAATFLTVLGWLCIFSEGLFPKEGDFSRDKFGKAFYRSGFAAVTTGLGLVIWSQCCGFFAPVIEFLFKAPIGPSRPERMWACGLIVFSSAAFAAEYLIRGSRKRDAHLAIGLMGWAILSFLGAFDITLTLPIVSITLCVVQLVRFAGAQALVRSDEEASEETASNEGFPGHFIDWWIGATLIASAFTQFLTQFPPIGGHLVFAAPGWSVTLQMACTAVALWMCGASMERMKDGGIFQVLSILAATFASISLAVWVVPFGIQRVSLSFVANLAFLGPIVAVVTMFVLSRFGSSNSERLERRLSRLSLGVLISVATIWMTMFFMAGANVFHAAGYIHITGIMILSSALLFASAHGEMRSVSHALSCLAATIALACLMAAGGLAIDCCIIFSMVLAGAIGAVLAEMLRRSDGREDLARSVELPANLTLFVGSLGGMLLSLNRAFEGAVHVELVIVAVIQLACIAAAGLCTRETTWRLAFRAMGLGTVLAIGLNLTSLLNVAPIHRIELVAIIVGIASVALGHIAWAKEGEDEDETATLALWGGSALIAIPLSLGLLYGRFFAAGPETGWMLFHEIGVVVAGLAMLALGFGCRIRATTFGGAVLGATFFVSILALIRVPSVLQNASVVMMVAGGALFTVAILLSLYRDRVVTIPEKMRDGEGVFQVLRWR